MSMWELYGSGLEGCRECGTDTIRHEDYCPFYEPEEDHPDIWELPTEDEDCDDT